MMKFKFSNLSKSLSTEEEEEEGFGLSPNRIRYNIKLARVKHTLIIAT
jgi:hypothetical protein